MLLSRLTLALAGVLALAACSAPEKADKGLSAEQRETAAKTLFERVSEGNGTVYDVQEAPDGLYKLTVGPKDAADSSRSIVWMSSNAKVLIIGAAFDENRNNLAFDTQPAAATPVNQDAAGQNPRSAEDTALQAQLLTRAADPASGSFVQGTAGPIVTAIVDLNCSHCNDFFTAAQPLIQDGKLRVRYVLAGFLTPTSEQKAAAVLSAKDPIAALKASEAAYRKDGGDNAIGKIDPSKLAVVKANTKILIDTKKPSTPYLFHCDKQSKQVVGEAGYAPDLAAFAGTIGEEGHPACSK
jgi:thiol:disulfide interchange protein DsbG